MSDETPDSDPRLSDAEEERLRLLLNRAAAEIVVPTAIAPVRANTTASSVYTPASAPTSVPASTPGRVVQSHRWLAVAAAVVVIAAIGGVIRWSSSGGSDQLAATVESEHPRASRNASGVDAAGTSETESGAAAPNASKQESAVNGGPAATSDGELLTSDALAPGGVWRLPSTSSQWRVADAESVVAAPSVYLAVDDVNSPARWLAVIPARRWNPSDGSAPPAVTHDLSNSMTATVLRPVGTADQSGQTWIDLRQRGDENNGLTFAYSGISDEEALKVVSEVAASITDLSSSSQVAAALMGLSLPDGLTTTWDRQRVGNPRATGLGGQSIQLMLQNTGSSDRVTVTITDSGLPPAVARLETLIDLQAPFLTSAVLVPGASFKFQPRVLVFHDSNLNLDTVVGFTDDGVAMEIDPVSSQGLSITERLAVLDELRPVAEAEFRSRMKDLGIDGP